MKTHLSPAETTPGYRRFHGEPFLDFELNRWLSGMDEAEVRTVAPRIKTIGDWQREMIGLGECAERGGRALHAATYYRAAEFYMTGKGTLRRQMIEKSYALFDHAVADWPIQRHAVPFRGGMLPVLIMRAQGEKRDTLVIHGGFDSYKEEFFMAAPDYAARGLDVVIFDGPGQGQAIRQYGLTMDHEWEKPVAAVLDHLDIESCTLMGFSLGGYLAPRAAAYEHRIKRVIADDALCDFFSSFTAKAGPGATNRIEGLLEAGAIDEVNILVRQLAATSETADWAITHGLEVSGSRDGFEFLTWLRTFRTAPFSDRITQDFLLFGAQEDHIAPIDQFYRQIPLLTNVKSLTARLFTRADHAHTHCQVANRPLVVDCVLSWIDFQLRADMSRLKLPPLQ